MRTWFAVQTHPKAEDQATRHLCNQGFDTLSPKYLRERTHARKRDVVAAPLFPGYIFVALDLAADRWRSIMSTIGVRNLVTMGGSPCPVPHHIISTLQDRMDAKGLVPVEQSPTLAPGDPLKIMSGPFKDCVGFFTERDDQRRVILMLELLGRTLRLPIAGHMVQPIG